MAKLYFYYSAMNAGKSTILLQSSHNYRERGMRTFLMCPQINDRDEIGTITSRIGLSVQAHVFTTADNLFKCIEEEVASSPLHCVLVDEAQFLTAKQVRQLSDVCDSMDIPVLAYGIRTDFQGHLFEGSAELLAYADELTELKTICHCGRKATMNMRIDANGQPVRDGSQILIGGNDRYIAVCRRHFKEGLASRRDDDLPLLGEDDAL
ncbi:MAG: thymidine kinase [Planctomycetota bacterium]